MNARRAITSRSLTVKIGAAIVLLLIWEGVSLAEHSAIILPSPLQTLVSLIALVTTVDFWASVGATIARGAAGFAISFLCGLCLGVAAGINTTLRNAISPLLTVVRSTPVMSVILIALIWFAAGWVPVFVAFLMVFPIICGNVMEGIRTADPKLLDMARIYRVPRARTIGEVYLPSVVPYVVAAVSTSLGITWKVVIAAEVLSQPIRAVGTGLELAKYRLDTAEVFAWTAVAIVLSALSESLLGFAERRIPWRVESLGN
jgi:NitT/TauT family transport system permease protein